MICATSNEQRRLKKLVNGNDGTTYQAAHDEKMDDSIDAGATEIHSTFVDGNLKKVYNNGRAMTDTDMHNYIQLDSEKTEGSEEQIGQHGIGAMKARARFSGPSGKEITTSISVKGECHQVKIDMGPLLNSNKTEIDCWTRKSEHRPEWTNFDNSSSEYLPGVTTEYESETQHHLDKDETVIGEMIKYQSCDNIEMKHTFDGEEFTVPKLISKDSKDVTMYNKRIQVYQDKKGKLWYIADIFPGGTAVFGPQGRGYGQKDTLSAECKHIADAQLVVHTPNIKTIITKDLTEQKDRNYTYMNSIHLLSKNISVEGDKAIINCGKNSIEIVADPSHNAVKNISKELKRLVFNGINIQQSKRILASCPISMWDDKKRSGDIDSQDLYEFTNITLVIPDGSAFNVAEETKSKVTLAQYPGLEKVLRHISETLNKYIKDKIKEVYEGLLTEEDKKKKKELLKKKKEEKKEAKIEEKKKKAKVEEKKEKVGEKVEEKVEEKKEKVEAKVEEKVEDKPNKVEEKIEQEQVNGHVVNSYYRGKISKVEARQLFEEYLISFPDESIDDPAICNIMRKRLHSKMNS